MVTITFDKQGGQGGSDSIQVADGEDIRKITIEPPTKTNCEFLGYYTKPNGGGDCCWDADNWNCTSDFFTSNTTLYAHWTAVPSSRSLGAGIGTNAKMNAVDENVRVAISTTSNAAYVISWSPDLRTNNPPCAYQVLHSPKLPVKESDWEELPVPEHPDWVVFPFDGSPNHFFKVKLLKKED